MDKSAKRVAEFRGKYQHPNAVDSANQVLAINGRCPDCASPKFSIHAESTVMLGSGSLAIIDAECHKCSQGFRLNYSLNSVVRRIN